MSIEDMSMAEFVRYAEGSLREALVAVEHDDSEQARRALAALFYDIDRYLAPEPWREYERQP